MLIDFHTHRPTAEGVITPRSFGIHPWNVEAETSSDFGTFRVRHLAQFGEAELVGEIGLDRVSPTDYGRQRELFEWQLRLAEELHKPVVIHCVRAFDDLLAFRQMATTAWVVHGFVGSLEQTAQLWRASIGVSFGAAILDPRRAKVRATLQQIQTPFFLETDDNGCDISDIYAEAARLRSTTTEMLADTINEHYQALIEQNTL